MPPRHRPPPTINHKSKPSHQDARGVGVRTRSKNKPQNEPLPASTQSQPQLPQPLAVSQTVSAAITGTTTAGSFSDLSESEHSDEGDIESELPINSMPGSDSERQEFASEGSQAALIAQLRQQLKDAEKRATQSSKRPHISSVSNVLEDHRAKKAKTSRTLPDPIKLHEKMARQFAISNASSPLAPSVEGGFSTSEPETPFKLLDGFQTPEPQQPSGLIDKSKPTQQSAYSPNHRDVFSQAKRYINLYLCTQNAFPDTSELHRMSQSALQQANADYRTSVTLTADIEKMFKQHIPKWRYRWKSEARKFISFDYALIGAPEAIQERVKYLISNGRYLYKQIITDPADNDKERYLRPFGHTSLVKVIHEAIFKLREGPARLRSNLIDPIPFEAIAFAGVVIHNCLDEYNTGTHKNVVLDGDNYASEYRKLLVRLSRYEKEKQAHCHELQKGIFSSGMALLDAAGDAESDFVIDSLDELL